MDIVYISFAQCPSLLLIVMCSIAKKNQSRNAFKGKRVNYTFAEHTTYFF